MVREVYYHEWKTLRGTGVWSFKNRGLVGAPIAMASSVFSVRDSGLGGWEIRREGVCDTVGRVPACPTKSQKSPNETPNNQQNDQLFWIFLRLEEL